MVINEVYKTTQGRPSLSPLTGPSKRPRVAKLGGSRLVSGNELGGEVPGVDVGGVSQVVVQVLRVEEGEK